MQITWTETQKQRLNELNIDQDLVNLKFMDEKERNQQFQKLERDLVESNKQQLLKIKNSGFRPMVAKLESALVDCLTEEGFVQVKTPIMLSRSMLEKMTITAEHPLTKQVFWIDKNKCLRPMLAPNLYSLLKDLERVWGNPVKIFEVGPCFRKESQGANHLSEFTMLNLVELGVPEGQQKERLNQLITKVMAATGLTDYDIITSESEVYGETVDIMAGDLELSSASYGPHSLDGQWGIFDPWVGIGIGLERVAKVITGSKTISRVGRSLSYLDGCSLNI